MKKFFIILLTFITLSLCSAQQRLISISAGLSTGVIIYDSEKIIEARKSLENGSRIILGGLFEVDFNPIKEVSFFAGADILTDFNSKTPYTSNHLSFDIPFGIKIYPNLAGFCFGLAYANGFRSDYFNLEESGKENSKTPWGNGFKFLIEYNFAHSGSSPYLPTVGGYWKHMPRGNSTYDNQLCIYVCSNF